MTTGKAVEDFPGGYIPFDVPRTDKPGARIDDPPVYQFCVNEEWLPLVVGALKSIGRPETWNLPYSDVVDIASEVNTLVGGITENCGADVPDKLCLSGTFDDQQYGYLPVTGGSVITTWQYVVGWKSGVDTVLNKQAMVVERDFGGATYIRSYSFHFTESVLGPRYDVTVQWKLNTSVIRTDTDFTLSGGLTISSSTPV